MELLDDGALCKSPTHEDSVQQEVTNSWLSVPQGSRNQFLEDIKETRVALGAGMGGKELQAANPKKCTFGRDPMLYYVFLFSFFIFCRFLWWPRNFIVKHVAAVRSHKNSHRTT